MTITYATDHADLWRALFTWLQTHAGLAENTVRRLNQVMGRPNLPYGTMQVIADVGGGVEGLLEQLNVANDDLDSVLYGPRRMTVQCNIYTAVEKTEQSQNAMTQLTAAVHSLRVPSVKALFKKNGLAFLQQLASIQAADQQLGQRWERRATVDLEFGYTAYTTIISEGKHLVSVGDVTEKDGTLIIQSP